MLDGADADAAQAVLDGWADAAQVAQLEPVQRVRQVGKLDHREPVRLLHVRRGLGQELVRRDADRAADRTVEPLVQRALDALGDRLGVRAFALAAEQPARHLVDGFGFAVRDAVGDRRHRLMVDLDVARRAREHERELGAPRQRLADCRAGADIERLRLVAGGDAAGGLGHDRHDRDRASAQLRPVELLDRSEEGVEVDEQAAQGHAGRPRMGRQYPARASQRRKRRSGWRCRVAAPATAAAQHARKSGQARRVRVPLAADVRVST